MEMLFFFVKKKEKPDFAQENMCFPVCVHCFFCFFNVLKARLLAF